jgi:UDP-N-acetylglucosamine acyltransferase
VKVHPTAIVDPSAELASDVEVGPYAVVGARVELGAGTRVLAPAMVEGPARRGRETVVHSFAVIGGSPQDKRSASEPGSLEAGDRNVFREHVTVHRGTGARSTRIGDDNLFMVGAHVAHDVALGSLVTLANGVMLAGHVSVGDYVTFGGAAAVAQHLRIGESAFVAGGAMVERDVPPFVVVQGDRARVRALNKVGLRRRGVDESEIDRLDRALRGLLFGDGPVAERVRIACESSDARVRALAGAWLRRAT